VEKFVSLSMDVLVAIYDSVTASTGMFDTFYLFQPHGPGTTFLFRMVTPEALTNPRTGKPYKREIRENLGGARKLVEPRVIISAPLRRAARPRASAFAPSRARSPASGKHLGRFPSRAGG
jgi:hypothetical protein